MTLEGQDSSGVFRLVDADVCTFAASDLDGQASFACNFEVPHFISDLTVFRLRAAYTSVRAFESATAFSDSFIIQPRAQLYSRRYADAALLTDQASMRAAMSG